MARNNFTLTTSQEIPTGTALKTILQLLAPSNVIVVVQGADISFDGISNTAEPVIVQWQRQTTAGTGGVSRNPLKTKDTSTSLGATGLEGPSGTWTAEPTAGDILRIFHIHPQAGVVYPLPLPDGELELASTGRLAIVVTAAAGVNCLATISGEE